MTEERRLFIEIVREIVPHVLWCKKARWWTVVWHGAICVNMHLCVCTNTYTYANMCTTFYNVSLPHSWAALYKLWPITCSWIDSVYIPGLRFKGSVSSALALLLSWDHHLKKPHTQTRTHTCTWNLDSVMKRNKVSTASTNCQKWKWGHSGPFSPPLSTWWLLAVSDSQRHSRKPPGGASPAKLLMHRIMSKEKACYFKPLIFGCCMA